MSIRTGVIGFALLFAPVAGGGDADAVDPAWQRSIERDIAALEYQVAAGSGGVLGAPNRAHGLRMTFDADGVTVRPRAADAAAFEWGLEFACFGRGEQVTRPEATTPIANGNRVEYTRGSVVEWYVNDARGLEQGFTIGARPEGEGDLVVALGIRGTLTALEQAGAIDFVTSAGAVALRYDKLIAFDAHGSALGAQMRLADGRIRIEVDDGGAVYPVTIDPLTTSPAWTASSDQFDAEFGISVASAGDVNGDGYSDVAVGAAYFYNGESNEGRAFVYLGSTAGLAASPAWTAECNQIKAYFGHSVATAGDVNGDGFSDVVVGAYGFDNGESDEGRAFVYLGSAGGLAASPAWTGESNQVLAMLGTCVATAGDVNGDGYSDVLVGAQLFDNGESNEGRAFLYLGSSAGPAASPAWMAESNQAAAIFSASIGTAGDVNGDGYSDVVVGARYFDNGETDEGRAFVYFGSTAGLAASPAWTAEGNQAGATLGWSVATAGDVNGDGYSDVVVGASHFDNGEFDEGRVLVYRGSATGLSADPAWTVESNQAETNFGDSVATAGDVNGDGYSDVIVGSSSFDNGETDEGRAFVYLGSAVGLVAIPAWTAESNQASAYFGWSVATAGDVNGDGCSDVVIGAHKFDNDTLDEGRAFVYHGSAGGPAESSAWTAESNQASAGLGVSVATAGDVNGDGLSDVVVGSRYFDNGETDEGRAFVYLGAPGGLAANSAWSAESDQASAYFGYSAATAGDVNGDGYSDLVVCAYAFDNGESNEGRVFVYLGSPAGLAASPAWTAESNQAGAFFGYSVATAGDVNGDGYPDVVVGANQFDGGESNEGRALVYFGSAAGLAASPAWTAESNQPGAEFGDSVGTAGDVNGDGYSDVLVGSPYFDNGHSNEGRAFVYLGSAAGLGGRARRQRRVDRREQPDGCGVR